MADFTGQNIQDTYQRVVQVDKGQLQDGTGSALPITFNGNDVIVPGAIRANSYIVSESLITVSSGSTIFGNSFDDTHAFSGSVSIRDKVNTDYNTVTPSLFIRQDAVDRSQIANGFGGSIDFFTQRGSNSSGARTGRISNFIFAGAQGISDQHAMKFTIRNDDTQVDALTIAPGSPDSKALIGIMDTSPSFTLDVNGTFRATGDINAGGNIVGDSATTITGITTIATSGDISTLANLSASQNVIGANLAVSTGRITGDTSKPTQLLVNGFISATHITASGDISASGTGTFSNVGIGTNNPSEELEIFKTGANAEMAITRGTDTQIKLKAQDTKTRITYEGGPLLFDRDESGTNTLALGIGGHITASGNISASGDVYAGNIGIGTDSPSAKLTVSGVATSTNFAEFKNANGIVKAKIGLASNNSGEITLIDGNNKRQVFISSRSNRNSHINAGNLGIGLVTSSAKLHISQSTSDPGLLVDGGITGSLIAKFRRSEGISPNREAFVGIHLSDSDAQIRFEPAEETRRWSIGASNTSPGNFEFAPSTKISGNEVIHLNRDGGIYASSITASADISASGTIIADKFNTKGAVYQIQGTKAIYTDSGTVFGRSPNITKISGSNIILKAHVTASGNISASGDILANQISVVDPTIFTVDGNGITHVNNLSVGNSLQNDTHTLIGKTEVRGNLTASNEISASGDIYGQTIYGHQFEQFSSNFTFNFDGTLTDTVFMPISDQSVSEHETSATNVNINRTSVVAGRPVKTVIRSTGNDNLRSVAFTCSVFYNQPGLGSAGAGPGDTNSGQLHLVSAGTMGPDSNHAAIEIDYSNPISGSYGDIPAGSRFYMTMDAKGAYSDSGDSITDLENTSFIVTNLWRWDYTQL